MSFWDKLKDFVGLESEYEEDYDDYEPQDEQREKNVRTEENRDFSTYNSNEATNLELKNRKEDRYSINVNSRVSAAKMIVSIREPLSYEDSKLVIDDLKSGKSVVLNIQKLEMDKKTQIFYFVSGGVYALNGSLQNVTKDIYVIAPEGTDINNAMKEHVAQNKMFQL